MNSKRDKIIKATLELIAENGFQGTSMARICERASIGVGTIYQYFQDKGTLISEVKAEIKKQLFISLIEGYPTTGSIREQYLHLHQRLLRFCIAQPQQFLFLDQYTDTSRSFGLLKKIFYEGGVEETLFNELFQRGIESGLLKDFPMAFYFALTFAPIFDLARDHIHGLIQIEKNQIKKVGEACWRAITFP